MASEERPERYCSEQRLPARGRGVVRAGCDAHLGPEHQWWAVLARGSSQRVPDGPMKKIVRGIAHVILFLQYKGPYWERTPR